MKAAWTFRWVDRPDALKSSLERASHVDILRPADRYRTARWTRVLHWYGAREDPSPREAAVPPSPPHGPHWVVALGDGPGAVARPLAIRLKRPMSCLSDPAEFGPWLENHHPQSVLLVALAADLDFENLTALHQLAIRHECWFGILTGADLAGLSFSAAKCLLAGNRPLANNPGIDLGIDAIFERQYRDGAEEGLTQEAFEILRTTDHRAVALLAHGEGAHLFLNHAVLCGLVSTTDRFRGKPFRNGCSRKSCKRAQGTGLDVLYATEIRAVLAAFLSCNSFSVTGQMYPSEASLALAAAEGYPAVILSDPWEVFFQTGDIPLLFSLLQAGVCLGEIVSFMNQTKARRDQVDSCVLLGDPLSSLAGTECRSDFPPVLPSLGGRKLLCAPMTKDKGVFEYRAGGRPVRRVFQGQRKALAEVDGDVSGPLARIDRTKEVEGAEARLTAAGPRIGLLADYENAVLVFAAQAGGLEPALAEALAALRGFRLRLEQSLTLEWRALAAARASGLWKPDTEVIEEDLRGASGAWDAAFSTLVQNHLLGGGTIGDRLFEVIHFGYHEISSRRGAPCGRCGVRTAEIELRHFRLPSYRHILECPLCGWLASHRTGGPVLRLGLPVRRRGRRVAVDIVLEHPGETVVPNGFLLLEVRDKAKPHPFLREMNSHLLVAGRGQFEFRLPANSGFDQHSIRAVWIGDLDAALAQRIFVLTPDPETV